MGTGTAARPRRLSYHDSDFWKVEGGGGGQGGGEGRGVVDLL